MLSMPAQKEMRQQAQEDAAINAPARRRDGFFKPVIEGPELQTLQQCEKELERLEHSYSQIKSAISLNDRYELRQKEYALDELTLRAEAIADFVKSGRFKSKEELQADLYFLYEHVQAIRAAQFAYFDGALPKGGYTVRGRSFFHDVFLDGKKVSEAESQADWLGTQIRSGSLSAEFVKDFLDWKASQFLGAARLAFEADKNAAVANRSSFRKVAAEYSEFRAALKDFPSSILGCTEALKSLEEASIAFLTRVQNENKITELYGGVKIRENLRQDIAGWLDLSVTLGVVTLGALGGNAGRRLEQAFFTWKASQQISEGDRLTGALLLSTMYLPALSRMYSGPSASAKAVSGTLAASGMGAGAWLFGSMSSDLLKSVSEIGKHGGTQEDYRVALEQTIFSYLGAKGFYRGFYRAAVPAKTPGIKVLDAKGAPGQASLRPRPSKRQAKAAKMEERKKAEIQQLEAGKIKGKKNLEKIESALSSMAMRDRKNNTSNVMELLCSGRLSEERFALLVKILSEKGFLSPEFLQRISEPGEARAMQQFMKRHPIYFEDFRSSNAFIQEIANSKKPLSFAQMLEESRQAEAEAKRLILEAKKAGGESPTSIIEKAKTSPDAALALYAQSNGRKGYFSKKDVPSLLELGKSSYPGFLVLAEAFKNNPEIFKSRDLSELIKMSYAPATHMGMVYSGNQLIVNKLADALLPNHALLGIEHVRLLSEAASFNPQFLDLIIKLSKLEPAGSEKGAAYSKIIAKHLQLPEN